MANCGLVSVLLALITIASAQQCGTNNTLWVSSACMSFTRNSLRQTCACLRWVNSDVCDANRPPLTYLAQVCSNITHISGPTVPLLRLTLPDYSDHVSAPAGVARKSPREISNIVSDQKTSIPNSKNATDWFWLWGQFIDHDLGLSTTNNSEPMTIPVPQGDSVLDPLNLGNVSLPFSRSNCFPYTGTSSENCREQVSVVSPHIDASTVYGSESGRTDCLRSYNGDGTLAASAGAMLPYDRFGLPQAEDPQERPARRLFVAGDIRVNEHIGLTTIHTLMMREHNRIARRIYADNPHLTDNEIFSAARSVVSAEVQRITYEQWLPLLLGPNSLPPYTGYDPLVNYSIAMEFSGFAFRVGHTMLSPQLRRLNAKGRSIGDISLADAFFNISLIQKGGITPIIRGFAAQVCQEIDAFVVDGVRNFLFRVVAGGLDLVAVNIQRGRDHGLASYNSIRSQLGLSPKTTFASITSNPILIARLEQAYSSTDDIDAFIGGISEDRVPGAMVGELFYTIITNQFTRTRDGDPGFYLGYSGEKATNLQKYGLQRLSDFIRANTDITNIQDNVFILN